MAKTVITIPALSMDRIDHQRVAAYICFDPENKAELKDRLAYVSSFVKQVYDKPKWKLIRVYWDYEPGAPLAERQAYKDFVNDISEDKIDILYMWALRHLSQDRSEIESFLSLLRNHNVTLQTYIEEIRSSVMSDSLILGLWHMGVYEPESE